MSERDSASVPDGPPWSLDVIADLHAGVYSPRVETELRIRIAGDPDATAMLAALNSVVDDLSLLPTPRMPEQYAARLDAAIAAESAARSTAWRASAAGPAPTSAPGLAEPPPAGSQDSTAPVLRAVPPPATTGPPQPTGAFPGATGAPGPTPLHPTGRGPASGPVPGHPPDGGPTATVVSLDAARKRRRLWSGLAVAAAVVAAATITVSVVTKSEPGGSASISTSAPGAPATSIPTGNSDGSGSGPGNGAANGPALQVDPGDLQQAFQQVNGRSQSILSGNPITFAACLAANGIGGSSVLGVADVDYGSRRAVAIAVSVDAQTAELFIVGPTCGPQGADLIVKQQVSR